MGKTESIINDALILRPAERYLIVETLLKSLDTPNITIEKEWLEEVKNRLEAYKQGKLRTIDLSEVFK